MAHDGWLQFGLISRDADRISEVFVAPTKHLKIWFSDETCLRSVLRNHALPEVGTLEFLDDYPRATLQLSDDKVSFRDHGEMIEHLEKQIGALP